MIVLANKGRRPMEFQLSDKAKDYIARTKAFIQTEIEPIEAEFWQAAHKLNPTGDWTTWQWPAKLEELKTKARAQKSLEYVFARRATRSRIKRSRIRPYC